MPVAVAVAAQHQGYQGLFFTGLCFAQHNQCLDDLCRRHLEEGAHFFNGVLLGRGHFMQ